MLKTFVQVKVQKSVDKYQKLEREYFDFSEVSRVNFRNLVLERKQTPLYIRQKERSDRRKKVKQKQRNKQKQVKTKKTVTFTTEER